MTAPRRLILRAPRSDEAEQAKHERRRERIQNKLDRATDALARWQRKLLRACHAVARNQQQLARLNRQLRELHSPRNST